METGEIRTVEAEEARSLVVVASYHHGNTEKIARAIAGVLGAQVRTPQEATPGEIAPCDLVGFGSGIYSATFHPSLLDLADRLLRVENRKAFLFSTYGAPAIAAGGDFVKNNHSQIREMLQARGYEVVGEFACAGWNTNSFLKHFGGLNRGRPNAGDLEHAEEFARGLKANDR